MTKRILFYLSILIILIILIFTVGTKLLINVSLYIANLSSSSNSNKSPSVSSDENNFSLPPEIIDLPPATNSAKLNITGKSQQKKSIAIYVNNDLQKEIVPKSEIFETQIELEEGENLIYLILTDSSNRQNKKSQIYKIIYKNKKPKLEITSPKDSEKVSKEEIVIVGETDQNTTIKINNLPAVVETQGKFSYSLKLKEGENKIIIEASDSAGNLTTKELTVIYQKEE